jgi:K+-sensing histidine kinase KdpD
MVEFLGVHRDRIAVIAALTVPPAVCAALIPVRTTLANTEAALVLVALTVAVAALGNRVAGYLAALGAAIWFDFFLTVPYERLTITHHTDAQTTLLLLCVGVATTELAVAARRRGRVVAVDEALLAVVQSTAALVARGEGAGAVIDQVAVQLKAILGLRGCVFEAGPGRVRGLHLEPDGALRWGAALWRLQEHGFPAEKVDLPARHRGTVHGRFALDPTPGTAPSIHARRIAVVLADLAAAAVAGDRFPARDA